MRSLKVLECQDEMGHFYKFVVGRMEESERGDIWQPGGFLSTVPPGSLHPTSLSQIQLGQELLSACSEQNGESADKKQGPRLEGGILCLLLSGGLPNSSEQLGGTERKCPHCPGGGVAYTQQGVILSQM